MKGKGHKKFELLQRAIEGAVRSHTNFNEGTKVELELLNVDHIDSEIHIMLDITTTESPSKIADNYYGLTRAVRDAIGPEWKDFFPYIVLQIN